MVFAVVFALLSLTARASCSEGDAACPGSVGRGLLQASKNSGRELLAGQTSNKIVEELLQGHQVDLKDIGQYVEGLAASVAGHNYTMSEVEKTALQAIRDMVTKMQNASDVEHAEDQAEVNRMRDLIQNCSSDAVESLGKVTTYKQLVNSSRGAHATCRRNEGLAKAAKEVACAAYDSDRKSSTPPTCMSTDLATDYLKAAGGTAQTQMETCLEAAHAWMIPLYAKYDNCKAKKETHSNQSADCDAEQQLFEQAFCTYDSKLEDACDTQSTCRKNSIAARNSAHDAVKVSVAARKADFAAGERLLCFLDVLRANNTHKGITLGKCSNSAAQSSKYDLTYPPVPAGMVCVKEQNKTCESDWTTKEYATQVWYVEAKTGTCQACPAPITTTLEPTTTSSTKAQLTKSDGWSTAVSGNGYAGIVKVYGHGFVQHAGYYAIAWPIITLSGTVLDGTWSIHAWRHHAAAACTPICQALTSTGLRSGYDGHTGSKIHYPSSASERATRCVWTNRAKSGAKDDWHDYQPTSTCIHSMKKCECQGTLLGIEG